MASNMLIYDPNRTDDTITVMVTIKNACHYYKSMNVPPDLLQGLDGEHQNFLSKP